MQEIVKGGTWFGMNKRTGDIGALLNIREQKPNKKAKKGRGFLVVDYLKLEDQEKKRSYLEELKKNGDQYNGFSLITIDYNKQTQTYSLSSFSNRSNCLKLNQSNQSFIITNSIRPLCSPFYRGVVFKCEFDTILANSKLINDKSIELVNLDNSNDLKNNKLNERTNTQINDSSDNLKDYSSTSFTTANEPNLEHNLDDKNCNKQNDQTNINDSKEANIDKENLIDFREKENREKLVHSLLEVMLSPRNYYEQEREGDYFKTQFCLADEKYKEAMSSLCISMPEHKYGSR